MEETNSKRHMLEADDHGDTDMSKSATSQASEQANPNAHVPTFMGKYHLVHCNLGLCASSPSVLFKVHFCRQDRILSRKHCLEAREKHLAT